MRTLYRWTSLLLLVILAAACSAPEPVPSPTPTVGPLLLDTSALEEMQPNVRLLPSATVQAGEGDRQPANTPQSGGYPGAEPAGTPVSEGYPAPQATGTSLPDSDPGPVETPLSTSPAEPEQAINKGLQGHTWQWIATNDPATGTSTTVDNPSAYQVIIHEGGRLTYTADCNQGAGFAAITGSLTGDVQIQLGLGPWMNCGDASRSVELMNGLLTALRYRVEPDGERMVLVIQDGTELIFINMGPA